MKLILLTIMIFSVSAAYVAHSAERPILFQQPHNTMCEQTTDMLLNDQAMIVLANATNVKAYK